MDSSYPCEVAETSDVVIVVHGAIPTQSSPELLEEYPLYISASPEYDILYRWDIDGFIELVDTDDDPNRISRMSQSIESGFSLI